MGLEVLGGRFGYPPAFHLIFRVKVLLVGPCRISVSEKGGRLLPNEVDLVVVHEGG